MYQIFLMSGIPCSRLSNSVFVVSCTALSNHSQEQPQQVPRCCHGTPLQHLQLQTGGGKSTPPVPPSPLSQGGQDDGRSRVFPGQPQLHVPHLHVHAPRHHRQRPQCLSF